jgi:regulator of cell morphogenesis and NO signaling
MDATQQMLNVSLIEPRLKHPTIFARFDDLSEGEEFIILNDHDPKPLYYQLLGERGNIFVWEYLEQGPDQWRVRIGKVKSDGGSETLGEIAAKDLKKAQIFKKYGLDFCCGGKKTVKEACQEKGLDPDQIQKELEQTNSEYQARPIPYNDWEIDFLTDYIVNTHHAYVRKTLPDIQAYANKVMRVHHQNHPELIRMNKLVQDIVEELYGHMEKEEEILFPYIKKLAMSQKEKDGFERSPFGSVQGPVNMMERDHETLGEYMEEVRALSKDYTLPEDACASYSLLYRTLDEFEDDLHLHIHLENNILFPKSLAIEKTFLRN